MGTTKHINYLTFTPKKALPIDCVWDLDYLKVTNNGVESVFNPHEVQKQEIRIKNGLVYIEKKQYFFDKGDTLFYDLKRIGKNKYTATRAFTNNGLGLAFIVTSPNSITIHNTAPGNEETDFYQAKKLDNEHLYLTEHFPSKVSPAQIALPNMDKIKVIAGKRIALVVGNGAYKSSPLKNTVQDSVDMAANYDYLDLKLFKKTM